MKRFKFTSSRQHPEHGRPEHGRPEHGRPKYSRPDHSRGFTLIEVMVALVIIAISLGALLSSSGTQARNASYLKQKTLAHWVAMNEMNELLLKKTYPDLGDKKGKTDMAGHTWYWIRTTKETEDKSSRQIMFTVYSDKIRQHNLTRLIAYVSR